MLKKSTLLLVCSVVKLINIVLLFVKTFLENSAKEYMTI